MAIETVCAGCGKRISVADESAGKRARCPACGHINPIPLNPSQLNPPPSGTGLPFDDFASRGARDASASGYDIDAPDDDLHDAFDGVGSEQSGDRSDAPPEAERYWMRAVDGAEYGPVDRQTLQRWFREGRVGPGYQLRQSRYENWRPAFEFQASIGGRPAANPFAGPAQDSNPYRPVASTNLGQSYPQADQGVFVLVMGMLGLLCCPIFGLVAWVVGHQALKSINAGLANPNSKGLVQIGYYLGIASVVMFILCYGGPVLLKMIK